MIYLISGSGQGAGKTTLAKKLGQVYSLADAIRDDLTKLHPTINWYDKSQAYKDTEIVPGTDKTVRQVMIEHGVRERKQDVTYWSSRLWDILDGSLGWDAAECRECNYAVDDIRHLDEVSFIRSRAKAVDRDYSGPVSVPVLHFHIDYLDAKIETGHDNEALRQIADYVITRK